MDARRSVMGDERKAIGLKVGDLASSNFGGAPFATGPIDTDPDLDVSELSG